jgi:hypothetical protein
MPLPQTPISSCDLLLLRLYADIGTGVATRPYWLPGLIGDALGKLVNRGGRAQNRSLPGEAQRNPCPKWFAINIPRPVINLLHKKPKSNQHRKKFLMDKKRLLRNGGAFPF